MEYQIVPYDYYVREYFLAKSLMYVVAYIEDETLFEVALWEALEKFKVHKRDILKHVNEIKRRFITKEET
jgi:hypothetical protein